MLLLMAVAQARRKAHSEVAKTAGLLYIFAGMRHSRSRAHCTNLASRLLSGRLVRRDRHV